MKISRRQIKNLGICSLLTVSLLPGVFACGKNQPAEPAPVVELTPAEDPVLPSAAPTPVATVSAIPSPTVIPTPVPPREMAAVVRDELAPELVAAYSAKADAAQQKELLDNIRTSDPASADAWEKILAYWDLVNQDGFTNLFTGISDIREDVEKNGIETTSFSGTKLLPAGLAADDRLCFVVLGFALNSDGTPRKELVDRLITVTGCAQEYPEARILLTGGPTAYGNPSATEADAMADWLTEHGVDRERLIIENRSLITYDNAVFSYDILRKDFPQIRQLVIVSSDYHIPLGCLLFETECLLRNSGEYDLHVIANVGCTTDGYYHFGLQDQAKQVKGLFANR